MYIHICIYCMHMQVVKADKRERKLTYKYTCFMHMA